MKIGFDGKRAVQNKTGLGNYSRFIIDVLSRYFAQGNEYVLYAPVQRENSQLENLLKRENVSARYPSGIWKGWLSTLWRVWGVSEDIRKDGIQLFHGLSNELPLSIRRYNLKSIVTMHDLIFLRFPQYYSFIDRHIYAYKFRKACENSHHIIAISEATKRDIVRYFGIREDKISVVYQGCAPIFKQPVADEVKKRVRSEYNLPTRYILNVGSIESRKNLLLVVQALTHLPEDVKLVAVGKQTPYMKQIKAFIRQHQLEKRVQVFHKVPFADLPAFYQMASLFVYPSRFEGFGIPIIEAIHGGLPVIAATGSCLEEAGGPSSAYVDPNDEKAWAKRINEIWCSPSLAEQMKRKGFQYVQCFSDENIALKLMKLYKRILEQ